MNKHVTIGLYLNAAVLIAIAVLMLNRSDAPALLPTVFAQQQPQPIAGGAGLFLMPGQLSPSTWGCYVMDVDRQTLMVYSFADKKLKLMAARQFVYDRRLTDFQTELPPDDVRALVEKAAEDARINPKD